MKTANKKSDLIAKQAWIKRLEDSGFKNASIISSPADVRAFKNEEEFYFEIKMTRHRDRYFGAAALTEWAQALKDPAHFRFVVAIQEEDEIVEFKEYTPEEFMMFSSVPPFKVYFNIDFENGGRKPSKGVSKEALLKLVDFYAGFKTSDIG